MNSEQTNATDPKKANVASRILSVIASFNIAVVAFAMMIVVTFAGTWLQKKHGLYDCQRWFFESWITPREAWIWGWLPLPGMALLLAIIFVNVLAGGIIRIRKSRRTIGVVIGHLSMLGFIIAGAVSLWTKTEGHLVVYEKESNSIVEAHQDWVIEVRELTDLEGGKPAEQNVYYFPDSQFNDCEGDRSRKFFKSAWPFELKVSGYIRNASVVPAGDPTLPADAPREGDFALKELKVDGQNERNFAGVHIEAIDETGTVARGLLSPVARSPLVFESASRRFALSLTRERWELPFTVHLEDFRATYYPGTQKAKEYESDVRVLHGGGRESKHRISMNNPLRDSGYVAYQASFDSTSPAGQEKYSDFQVVKNRSDQWPLYSLIVCTIGLVIHFLQKLTGFLRRSSAVAHTPVAP